MSLPLIPLYVEQPKNTSIQPGGGGGVMWLPPLHTLSISSFTPTTEIPTNVDNEHLKLPDWRTPREKWRLDIVRFLVNRARVEGVEFNNASGVVFDEEMLFRQAGCVHPFAPVLCTPDEYRYFAEADYYAEEGGVELYMKHLNESGVGALFKMLEDRGPDITVKQAIKDAKPRPARLKLLLELLEGRVTMPESQYGFDTLEQMLHAVSGMRDPSFVNIKANNKAGNATNTGFEYLTMQTCESNVFIENGQVTRSFFSNPEINECCEGNRGNEVEFEIGHPTGPYLDNDFGAKDVINVEEGKHITFVTLNTMAKFADTCSELEGCMFFNRGQVYTSMSPRWTFEPEGFDPDKDEPLVTYALRVHGPIALKCTIQEPRSNYIDMALISNMPDEHDGSVVNIKTAMLPVVILPARMAFKINRFVASPGCKKRVVFATYIAYSKKDSDNFPKRHSTNPQPEIITEVLSESED